MYSEDFTKLLQKKQGFIFAVYSILILELMVTFGIVYGFRYNPTLSEYTKKSFWVYLLTSLGLILILTLVSMPVWLKFLLFTMFSVVTGSMLHYASHVISKEAIDQALIGAIGIFVTMSIAAVVLAYLGIDLGFLGIFLLAALIGLLVASLILLFTEKRRNVDNKISPIYKLVLVFGLVLFSLYIMYFTNIILQKNYGNDFISAAIDLYLSFINTFTRLLILDEH